MFNWLFKKKRKKEESQNIDLMKKELDSTNNWLKHLDSEKNLHKKEIDEVKNVLSTIKEEVKEIKNVLSVMNNLKVNNVFKTPKQLFKKQTPVYAVQTGVQTGVQTPNFDQFSITEKAIFWILVNSDMKLSYEDLAAMLGKSRSTIRGQINTIKQKSESLVKEIIEKNGKKRVFIPEDIKETLLKKAKVRVKPKKNKEKPKKAKQKVKSEN
jgi:response regulator of citrate/malate metabolism